MSNAGKKMLNWKKDFPVLRVALGLLGQGGYTSMFVARHVLADECTLKLRAYSKKVLGREMTDSAISSRLKQVGELEWFRQNDMSSYNKGKVLRDDLVKKLRKAGIEPFGALGSDV